MVRNEGILHALGWVWAIRHSRLDYAYDILVGKIIKLEVMRQLDLVSPLFFFFRPTLGLYFLVCKVRGEDLLNYFM